MPIEVHGEYAKLRLPMKPVDLTFEESINMTIKTQTGTHWLKTFES